MSRNVGPTCRWTPPRIAPRFKPCRRCFVIKPVADFDRFPGNRDRLCSYCRACQQSITRNNRTEYGKRYRAHMPETLKARDRARARRRTLLANPPRSGICVFCGDAFTTRNRTQTACSVLCRRRHRDRGLHSVPQHTRRKILVRDGWRCYLCLKSIDPTIRWPHPMSPSVDHVKPVSAGGSSEPSNLRATHWHCNEEKGDALPGVEVWIPGAF